MPSVRSARSFFPAAESRESLVAEEVVCRDRGGEDPDEVEPPPGVEEERGGGEEGVGREGREPRDREIPGHDGRQEHEQELVAVEEHAGL
jgi:hypothetical protein